MSDIKKFLEAIEEARQEGRKQGAIEELRKLENDFLSMVVPEAWDGRIEKYIEKRLLDLEKGVLK